MTNGVPDIWRLEISIGKKWQSLQPHDLEYFSEHFIGERLPDAWTPPPYKLLGKSKKSPDFMSWMLQVPVVSERVANALSRWDGTLIQFLPFDTFGGRQYFAMNVLALESGALDESQSNISRDPADPDYVMSVAQACFRQEVVPRLPPVFKLGELRGGGDVYVNREFCEIAVREQFTGLKLSDPTEDSFRLLVRGLQGNVFPGLPG